MDDEKCEGLTEGKAFEMVVRMNGILNIAQR